MKCDLYNYTRVSAPWNHRFAPQIENIPQLAMQIHLKPNCVLDQVTAQHWSVGILLAVTYLRWICIASHRIFSICGTKQWHRGV